MKKLTNAAKQKRYRQKLKRELKALRKCKVRMQLKMYAVRDAKAETFNPPFYKHTHGEAERDFVTLVNDGKSTLNQYPDDFDLYYIGSYDTDKGIAKSLDTPQHMMKAINAKKVQ